MYWENRALWESEGGPNWIVLVGVYGMKIEDLISLHFKFYLIVKTKPYALGASVETALKFVFP